VPVGDFDPAVDLAGFRSAGRILFSLALVRGEEGNLSTFDGSTLAITRTGVSLAGIDQRDVLTGGLAGDLPGASSDLEVHRAMYRERGPGAVVHAPPPGTAPEGGGKPGGHGVFAFAPTLSQAVEAVVEGARTGAPAPPTGLP
jgi:ribulose-5-phosphate 4-epimerase/fuculose-1-phosphate aldolase